MWLPSASNQHGDDAKSPNKPIEPIYVVIKLKRTPLHIKRAKGQREAMAVLYGLSAYRLNDDSLRGILVQSPKISLKPLVLRKPPIPRSHLPRIVCGPDLAVSPIRYYLPQKKL